MLRVPGMAGAVPGIFVIITIRENEKWTSVTIM
jgi:hypothetical protein